MKFRNILLTTFAASAFVIGTTSCSDSFLDEKMYSSYGPEVSDVNAKLVGLHRQYAAIWGMSSQQGFVGCWQVGTDVGAPGDTQGVEVPFYRYQKEYLQPIITQYFIDNKSEIWLLFLIAHSKR